MYSLHNNYITSGALSCPVILGLRETEERYYLLVKEARRFREALMNCKLRGGTLVMPKTTETNRLIADYVSQAGLTRVYIGLQGGGMGTVSGLRSSICACSHMHILNALFESTNYLHKIQISYSNGSPSYVQGPKGCLRQSQGVPS